MTSVEQILSGIVILFVGGFGSRALLPSVSKGQCEVKHSNLEQLIDEKMGSIEQRLERIENKLDRMENGIP
jgi:hypothetical protein